MPIWQMEKTEAQKDCVINQSRLPLQLIGPGACLALGDQAPLGLYVQEQEGVHTPPTPTPAKNNSSFLCAARPLMTTMGWALLWAPLHEGENQGSERPRAQPRSHSPAVVEAGFKSGPPNSDALHITQRPRCHVAQMFMQTHSKLSEP